MIQKLFCCTFVIILSLLCAGVFAKNNGNQVCSATNKDGCRATHGTIVVFGGTGFLGRECVFQALKASYNVIVLLRDPSKLLIPEGSGGSEAGKPFNNPRLKVITGDVKEPKDVDSVFEAADDILGVIVSLGGKTKLVGKTMLTNGTTNIINSMKNKSQTKRIAVVTSIGAGDSAKYAPLTFKALMYTVMRGVFKDKNNQEKLFIEENGIGHDLE
jgi:hypothetical protein